MSHYYTAWLDGLPPMGKARPRFYKKKVYMPSSYRKWQERFCWLLKLSPGPSQPLTCPVKVSVMIYTKTGKMRSDLDNAIASVWDGLQKAGWIANDRQVSGGAMSIEQGDRPGISVSVETI